MEHAAVEQRADRVHRVVERGVRLALDGRAAARGAHEPEHDPQCGRLAGAVRAEEADDPARLHREREVVDGERLSEPLRQPCDFDGWHSHPG
jgi:hypothetical protein